MKMKARDNHYAHSLPVQAPRQPYKRAGLKDKASADHQEFIREMNEFVAKHGSITDDEFFRVL